jgi:hypothetical protein
MNDEYISIVHRFSLGLSTKLHPCQNQFLKDYRGREP